MDYIRALPHPDRGGYAAALSLLAVDPGALIAHIDSGVAPHPAFGWAPGDPPPDWLLLDQGANFHDPDIDPRPVARMHRDPGLGELLDYPDHGVKTLSALCGNDPGRMVGVVPGARVVPYRVSNGPLFRRVPDSERGGGEAEQGPAMRKAETARMGEAINHALDLPTPPPVMTISMGNPGDAGPIFQPVLNLLGGEAGMAPETADAVNRAYEAGVILCCAAGQVIDRIVYPARWERTVAVSGYDAEGTGGQVRHYPPMGYGGSDADALVDIWCQAQRINRAGYKLDEPDADPPWDYAEDSTQGAPSGTSYACPQAAGAAALWRARWNTELERWFGRPSQRWKIVEAFRHALRNSAALMPHRPFSGPEGGQWPRIRTLNIPALLATPPREDWPLRKRPRAS